MQVGMTLPVMEPGLDAGILEEWARAIDSGVGSGNFSGSGYGFPGRTWASTSLTMRGISMSSSFAARA